MRPPEPDTRTTHIVLGLVSTGPAVAMWAFAPSGSLPLASALFIGPLTAVWMVQRRQILAHLLAAGFVLCIPALTGMIDTASTAALVFMIPTAWALAGCCIIVLAAAETQVSSSRRSSNAIHSPGWATAGCSTSSSTSSSRAPRNVR